MPRPRILLDVQPLRQSPDFRRLWIGSGLSTVGSTMTAFAVVLQVYRLTGSSVAVGGVGLAMALPAVAFGLVGGSVADAMDRRRVVLVTSSCLALVSATFAWQSYAGMRSPWLLYGLVALQSALVSVNSPARRTFMPRLLPPEQLAAGAALNMLAMHGAVILGPALAGLVAGMWGLTACYVVDAVSVSAALYAAFRLPPMRPDTITRPGLAAIVEALRYVVTERVLLGAFLSDTLATVLGMPFAIFPAINAQRFGGAPQTLGLFTASVASGGVIGTALSGPVGQVRRTGRAMVLAGTAWGAALVGFGLAHQLWLALAMLALAGVADVINVVFRSATVQLLTPDRQRGRVGAVEYVVGAGLPQLGNFRAGAVASLTSPGFSAVSGGLSVIAAGGLLALALPAFVRYRAPVADRSTA